MSAFKKNWRFESPHKPDLLRTGVIWPWRVPASCLILKDVISFKAQFFISFLFFGILCQLSPFGGTVAAGAEVIATLGCFNAKGCCTWGNNWDFLNFCLKYALSSSTELLSRADGGLVSGKQRDHSSVSAVAGMERMPVSISLTVCSKKWYLLSVLCSPELLKLEQLSRNPGVSVCEGDGQKVMEKAVHVSETLRIVLLDERNIKGMLALYHRRSGLLGDPGQ